MRLDLRDVIHRPDAEKPFRYQLDLSQLDFTFLWRISIISSVPLCE